MTAVLASLFKIPATCTAIYGTTLYHAVNGDGRLHLALFSFPLFYSKAANIDVLSLFKDMRLLVSLIDWIQIHFPKDTLICRAW